MNIAQLFQLFLMLAQAGALMETLQTGNELHTKDLGAPPVFVNWRDGRRFEIDLRIQRTK